MGDIELQTQDKLEYVFYPNSSGSVRFKVRTSNDAHVALSTCAAECDPMYEIFIGGWGNQKSVIRKNRTKPDKAEAPTPGILNAGEFRTFWVRWQNGAITVGCESNTTPFLSWTDHENIPISYVGFCTGWGATGSWIVLQGAGYGSPSAPQQRFGGGFVQPQSPTYGGQQQQFGGQPQPFGGQPQQFGGQPQPFGGQPQQFGGQPGFQPQGQFGGQNQQQFGGQPGQPFGQPQQFGQGGVSQGFGGGSGNWLPSSGGQVPPQAFVGGEDRGEQLYVVRGNFQGAQIPGKLVPSHRTAYVPWGGAENAVGQYEVLCNFSGRWQPCSGGNIPPNAVQAGRSEDGEPLYVGRARHDGALTVGKVQRSHGVCYIPYGGQELNFPQYEILVS